MAKCSPTFAKLIVTLSTMGQFRISSPLGPIFARTSASRLSNRHLKNTRPQFQIYCKTSFLCLWISWNSITKWLSTRLRTFLTRKLWVISHSNTWSIWTKKSNSISKSWTSRMKKNANDNAQYLSKTSTWVSSRNYRKMSTPTTKSTSRTWRCSSHISLRTLPSAPNATPSSSKTSSNSTKRPRKCSSKSPSKNPKFKIPCARICRSKCLSNSIC